MTRTLTEAQVAVRKTWVTALRSGDYAQGQNELKPAEGGYCCLGVLCDLLDPNGWGVTGLHRGDRHFPNPGILAAAGLSVRNSERLSNLNDLEGLTFSQIADVIDAGNLADDDDE